jgi:hypothetical protein
MTVDASRSCLGLATSIGSEIRQIVDARVLLAAAAPPALPGSSMSNGSLAPPWMRSRVSSDQPAVGGTRRAMAQMKPTSSRAIAAVTTLAGLPVRASCVRQVQQIDHGNGLVEFRSKHHPCVRSKTAIPSSRPACRQSTAHSGSQGCRRDCGGTGGAGAQRPPLSRGQALDRASTVLG